MSQTIAALATPPGKGAIAIVRVSGPAARDLASRLFVSRAPLLDRVATYGEVRDERGDLLDRGLAIFCGAPHTYTGEDTLELHVHGSPVIVREVLRALLACGARYALAGEFTRRAFLNGKLDLQAACAVADVIDAESRSAARAAAANFAPGLAAEVRALRARIAGVLEELAAAVDFPDEVGEPERARITAVLEEVRAALHLLRWDAERGRLVREGVGVAIVGPPNAGKSSLLNALLGEERALVSPLPGTTRDTIEESIAVDGVQVRLIDTAGIRSHADHIEAAGIERTRRALAHARVALVVLDGSQRLSADARAIVAQTKDQPRVLFANKSDVGERGAREIEEECVRGSVRDAATLQRVRKAIARVGWGGEMPDLERPHLTALHEIDAANGALVALDAALETIRSGEALDFAAGDLQQVFAQLGRVSGDTATEEMLDGIFARFCIGK